MPLSFLSDTFDRMTQHWLRQQCALFRAHLNQAAASPARMPGLICNPLDVHGVSAEFLYWDQAAPARYVLYLHGGGYTFGSIDTHRRLAATLAQEADARVLIIDYRLAPEAPYPAALDDAEHAYQWLLEHGVQGAQIAVAGDSAGGGLALALMQRLHVARQPMPACSTLLSPWLDLTCSGSSMDSNAMSDPILNKQQMQALAALYAADIRHDDPGVSPLYGSLAGLPPLQVQVSSSEVLLDDARRLARWGQDMGSDIQIEQWAALPHAWPLLPNYAVAGQQTLQAMGRFISQHALDAHAEVVSAEGTE